MLSDETRHVAALQHRQHNPPARAVLTLKLEALRPYWMSSAPCDIREVHVTVAALLTLR